MKETSKTCIINSEKKKPSYYTTKLNDLEIRSENRFVFFVGVNKLKTLPGMSWKNNRTLYLLKKKNNKLFRIYTFRNYIESFPYKEKKTPERIEYPWNKKSYISSRETKPTTTVRVCVYVEIIEKNRRKFIKKNIYKNHNWLHTILVSQVVFSSFRFYALVWKTEIV